MSPMPIVPIRLLIVIDKEECMWQWEVFMLPVFLMKLHNMLIPFY